MDYTLCLCMIVKNESKIIERLLNSVINIIDCYCICDTGSSDNTVEIIENYFRQKKITGKLLRNLFVNFAYNRSFVLENSANMSDYALLLDADMKLKINNFDKNIFLNKNIDEFKILQGNENVQYLNTRIVRNNGTYKYYGVTHEYISGPPNMININLSKDTLFIYDIGDGGSKQNKFERDIQLLEKGIIDEPDNSRYLFYLANSYYDLNRNDEAIIYYKKLLDSNAWIQEKYVSCFKIHECYVQKKQEEFGLHYLVLSYKYDSIRVECIYKLIKYYCIAGMNEISLLFYQLIQNYYENKFVPKNDNNICIKYDENINCKLFLQLVYYKFYLPYYMIIVSEKLKKYEIGIRMFEIIFELQYIDAGEILINNLIYNLQFFIYKNTDIKFVNKMNSYFSLIKNKNVHNDLINKYEIYNVSNFTQLCPEIERIENPSEDNLVIAILAKDKENTLPFYLSCIYNQTYNKKYIHLYIRTNDNNDNTEQILIEFIEKYGKEYASVYFDNSTISESIKQYSPHTWNSTRFEIIGKIRQDSTNYAIKLNAHYFTADCDNFIIPITIEKLMRYKNSGIISPMLKTGFVPGTIPNNDYDNKSYSNFHYQVDDNGYYIYHKNYYSIIDYNVIALSRVCCVHCTYLIPSKYLSFVSYIDNTKRNEYVILSESFRKQMIPQYIDNTEKYGYLTFKESNEEMMIEYNYYKEKYAFLPYN